MISGTVVLLGTWDSKARDYEFVRSEIERRGYGTLTIDAGVRGESAGEGQLVDIGPYEVARAGDGDLNALRAEGHRGKALEVMARGAARICERLHREGQLHAILAMGGGGGTELATAAMRALPLGVPKLMVSTLASGNTSRYLDISDIVMMPAIVDIAGLNRISRDVYRRAAGAICGMLDAVGETAGTGGRVQAEAGAAVAVSMFGNTMKAVSHAVAVLEQAGYEVLTFHATGTGGRTMERLISEGHFTAVLDFTTTEIADHLFGGVLSAGPERLTAAGAAGLPQVVVPGCVDMINFWGRETVPERFANRLSYAWNPDTTLVRTSPEENGEMARFMAQRLNAATGPVRVFIPTGGFSELGSGSGPFRDPEADNTFAQVLISELQTGIPVTRLDYAVNDSEFAEAVAVALLSML